MTSRPEPIRLTEDAARTLTNEVKSDVHKLWGKLLQLHQGGAHTALGYSSWAEYCRKEFSIGRSHAYRLLDAGRVAEIIESAQSPTWGLGAQSLTEGSARELVPVLREDPDRVQHVWGEVIEEHGPKPTAAQVRQTISRPSQSPLTPTSPLLPRRLTPQYLDTPRKRAIAENAARRLFETVAARGHLGQRNLNLAVEMKIDQAMPALTDRDLEGMIRSLDHGLAATRRLRRDLQKHLDLRRGSTG
jgi:hypothetical protein